MAPFPARLTAAAYLALGLALGLAGLQWGLPSRARVDRVLPPGLDGAAFHQRMSESWGSLHRRLGKNLMLNPESFSALTGVEISPAGWKEPPEVMLGPLRSFYIRSAHEDEQTLLIILSRMRPWKLELHPYMFTYGATYIYSVGVWLGAAAVVGLAKLHTGLGPYLTEPDRMASLYLAGRLLSTVMYLGCAWLLWRIGRRHFERAVGGLAALLFLVCPAAVIQAHLLKNHVFWSFFALLTLERSLALLGAGGLKAYALTGAASGLTVGSFLSGWPACLIVAAAGAVRVAQGADWREELKGLVVAGAASAGAFFLTNPYWLVDLPQALAEMKVLSGWSAFDLTHPFVFLWGPVWRSVGPVLLALSLGGALWAFKRGRRDPALLLCALAFLIGLSSMSLIQAVTATRQARYFLGWLGVGLLLAARAGWELARPGAATAVWARPVLAAAVLHMALLGAVHSYNFRVASTDASNHVRSGDWVERHIPPGASIGMLRLPQPSNAPYFRYDLYEMRFIEPQAFPTLEPARLPQYLAVVSPDYDERPAMEPNLSRYERVAVFDRPRLAGWWTVDSTATTANPLIEIYRLRAPPEALKGAP